MLGSLIFVILGVFFVIKPEIFEGRRSSHEMIFLAGAACTLFFGVCLAISIRKIFSKQVGLIINSEGLIDKSAGNSAGEILWIDVKDVVTINIMNQKFVSIIVKNPDKYIDAQRNFFKRKLMAQNYKMIGTPISISPNTLKISFTELYNILQQRFENYKQNQNHQTLL